MNNQPTNNGREMVDFERIYRQNYQQLFSFGYQLCANRDLTKDALQEVFLIIWERKAKLGEIDNLPAYLKKITHRQIIKRYKADKVYQLEIDDKTLEIPVPSYEDLLLGLEQKEDQRNMLAGALDSLSPTEKEMIKQKFLLALSYDQIAERTGKTKQTIYNQVFTALRKLKKVITPNGQ